MALSRQSTRREPKAWQLADCPDSLEVAAAESFCRILAERHYENFTVASRLVPATVRQDLANIYAFARWADDLADESSCPEEAIAGLADWRSRLGRVETGTPDHPVFVALAQTVRRHSLPIEPFHHLLDAFEQDQSKTRYESRAELMAYCRLSANPVGRLVLGLAGCREPSAIGQSDSICTGLQLVNFWQDIVRDRRAGRIYVPREDMARHGVLESDFDRPEASQSVRYLVQDLVTWARGCFDAGSDLLLTVPKSFRPAVGLFIGGGRAVADAIRRQGFDTLRSRPVVSRVTKARLVSIAFVGRWWRSFAVRGSR